MTKFSIMVDEVHRVLGWIPGPRSEALRERLVRLCREHWQEMRGPMPSTCLAKALWGTPPHLSSLFAHLYAIGDSRLADVLGHMEPQQGLALLVLAEIEHGEAEGARSAYAEMHVFESPAARAAWLDSLRAGPGGHAPGARLRHAHRPVLWRAVVEFATQTGRWDLDGVLAGLGLLGEVQAGALPVEPDAQPILALLDELGVTILGIEADHLRFAVRGEEHEPVHFKKIADILAEGREAGLEA
ncbi:MAG: hypothetical protein AB1713_02960 [Pseudomonadota bacterium]